MRGRRPKQTGGVHQRNIQHRRFVDGHHPGPSGHPSSFEEGTQPIYLLVGSGTAGILAAGVNGVESGLSPIGDKHGETLF
jgi:hypothetical protein